MIIKNADYTTNKYKYENGRAYATVDLFVDTVDELPAVEDIDGYHLLEGSTAFIVTTGQLSILASTGEWYTY